jgi:hypothetical protein
MIAGTTLDIDVLAYDRDGALYAPTALTFTRGLANQGAREEKTLADFANPSTGRYTATTTPNVPGDHWWEIVITDSAGAAFPIAGNFHVEPRKS